MEGRGVFRRGTKELKWVHVYKYDEHGNRIVQYDSNGDDRQLWTLSYYSSKKFLLAQEIMSLSEGHMTITERRNFFYGTYGTRTGWETVFGDPSFGEMRTLHQFIIEQHSNKEVYKDFRVRNGELEETANEYFVLDGKGNKIEIGSVNGTELIPNERSKFDQYGIEIERMNLKAGKVWMLMNNEVHYSDAETGQFSDVIQEFNGLWEEVKDQTYPKAHYNQVVSELARQEREHGLPNPFKEAATKKAPKLTKEETFERIKELQQEKEENARREKALNDYHAGQMEEEKQDMKLFGWFRDYSTAFQLYTEAAKNGSIDAKKRLANFTNSNGKVTKKK